MKIDNFTLKDVKVLKEKVSISYTMAEGDEEKTYNVTSKITPHPDIKKALDNLKEYLADLYHVDDELISTHGMSANSDGTKIIIKGMLTLSNEQLVSINSSQIAIEGYDGLQEHAMVIAAESYAYLFNGKTSQTKLDLTSEEPNQDDNDGVVVTKTEAEEIKPEEIDNSNDVSLESKKQDLVNNVEDGADDVSEPIEAEDDAGIPL